MVQYRSFRNDDPPHLVDIWNLSLNGRGAVRLRHSSPFDNYVLAKPYFERTGLIVAEDNGNRLGFAHVGFRANANESGLSKEEGVLCALCVRPTQQRQGIGSDLLRAGEEEVRRQGARTIFAGPHRPRDPFYFGLYGGCNLPGFLASDAVARPFFEKQGYQQCESRLVLQRPLGAPINVVDGRFPDLRRRFEISTGGRGVLGSWWQEAVVGPIDLVEFRLQEKITGQIYAQALVWDMEGFSWRWQQPTVGIYDITVRSDSLHQGYGKFLMALLLRYLQEQFFSLVEIQVPETNTAALGLVRGVGFEQVDVGHVFKKTLS